MAKKLIFPVALLLVGLGLVLGSAYLGGLQNTAQLVGGLTAAGGVYGGVKEAVGSK